MSRGAPGSGHQRGSSCGRLCRGVSLNLNTFLGVFSSSPVIEVVCYRQARHRDSELKIEEASLSRIDRGSEQTRY